MRGHSKTWLGLCLTTLRLMAAGIGDWRVRALIYEAMNAIRNRYLKHELVDIRSELELMRERARSLKARGESEVDQ